jgi:hypothetical protein
MPLGLNETRLLTIKRIDQTLKSDLTSLFPPRLCGFVSPTSTFLSDSSRLSQLLLSADFLCQCGEAAKDFYLVNGDHDRSDGIGPGESQTESATLRKNDCDRA